MFKSCRPDHNCLKLFIFHTMNLIKRFQDIQKISCPKERAEKMKWWTISTSLGSGRWCAEQLYDEDVVLMHEKGRRDVQQVDRLSIHILGEGKQKYFPRP